MLNKFSIKLIGILCALSISLCGAFVVFAEPNDGTLPTVSGDTSSATAPETSSEIPTVSSEPENVSTASSKVPDVTSSEVESVTPSVPQTVTSKENITASIVTSKPTASKVVTSKKPTTSSTTSKNASSKKPIVVKESSVTVKVNSYETPTESYTTDNRYNGVTTASRVEDTESISGEWDGKETELVSSEDTSSTRKLSKHLTDPKKAMMKWIWLPVILGLACIAFLVYYNVYYLKNSGSHTKKKNDGEVSTETETTQEEIDFFNFDSEVDEVSQEPEKNEIEKDPFSAENFFNFDNEE